MQAFPEPLSAGLFCAPRNTEVVRDDLERTVAGLVRGCLRRPMARDHLTGHVVETPPPIPYTLGRSALLTAELVSLWWLRPLADLLDHLIRAYRTQPQDVQHDFRRANRPRVLVPDAKKPPPLNLPEFIPGQCTPGA